MSKLHWETVNPELRDYELFGDIRKFTSPCYLILSISLKNLRSEEIDSMLNWVTDFIETNKKCFTYISLIPDDIHDKYGLFGSRYSDSNRNLYLKMYEKLTLLLEKHKDVIYIEIEYLFSKASQLEVFSDSNWLRANNPFSWNGNKMYVELIQKYLRFHAQPVVKVLIVDLDNTLWGGVIGETDYQEIYIGDEGDGRFYREFQKTILEIRDQGVILCAVTKNNESDVLDFFSTRTDMPIKLNDFVEYRANWEKKSENIANIARELNLGLESILFIDDSAFECQEVSQQLLDVNVVQFPTKQLNYGKWFRDEVIPKFFSKKDITKEDRNRNENYISRNARKSVKSLSLERCITRNIDDPGVVTRLSQMTEKTNQFNIRKQPMSETEVNFRINDPFFKVVAYSYSDQFGDEGIVGLMILEYRSDEVFIETLLLSCRVLGRSVEVEMLSDAKKYAVDSKLPLRTRLTNTSRNIPAQEFINLNCKARDGDIITL
jgi:FkbH-like protein